MSTTIMAQVWPLKMPPTPKAVLVSLADNANDSGHCWPSLATICDRTCFGRSAVIEAIQWLEQHCALKANRENGRHTTYQLTPARYSADQSASRTGPPAELVRQPDGSRKAGAKKAKPVRQPNWFASRTGSPAEPVRQPDDTRPPAGLDPSASRTLTIINRQEPSQEQHSLSPSTTDSQPGPTAEESEILKPAMAGTFEPAPDKPEAPPRPAAEVSKNGRAAILMRQAGATRINPSHPALMLALAEGVTPEELADTVREALTRNPPIADPGSWAITTARNRRSTVRAIAPVEPDPTLTRLDPVPYSAPRGVSSKTAESVREALRMADDGVAND